MFYKDAIKNDKAFSSKLTDKEIDAIFSPEKHLGASPAIINNVEKSVQKSSSEIHLVFSKVL